MRSGMVLTGALLLGLAACAQVGRPPGGPVDETAPDLVAVSPESLATGVDPRAPLRLRFSEKVDRRTVTRALRLVPAVDVERPRFDGLDVEFRPLRTWPADTVVVWTLETSLTDKHRVKLEAERWGAFTTGMELPAGRIVGRAAVRDTQPDTTGTRWKSLRAQLSLPPPEGSRRPTLWRQARGSDRGTFELSWLRPGSGPYQLEVFLDSNHDGRPGEKERSATIDSLSIAAGDTLLDLGELLLLDRGSPVDIVFCVPEDGRGSPRIWVRPAGESKDANTAVADTNGCAALPLVPADYEWGAWIDMDGDSKWGVDSVGVMEPHFEAPLFEVEPETPDSLAWSGEWRAETASAMSPEDSTSGLAVPASLRAGAP